MHHSVRRYKMADIGTGLIGLGAGLAIGISAIAAAMAEQQIGAAAVGATAENEKLFGKMLILTVIPETIVIFGLVIAYLLIQQMAGSA
jgi:V/A-type H+/Na+-transporting ATPase subunit K